MNEQIAPAEKTGIAHTADVCFKINKYLLWIPVLPAMFASTTDVITTKLGIQHPFTTTLITLCLLSYPVVYALSFAIAPKIAEKGDYPKAIVTLLSPLACLAMATIFYTVQNLIY